MWLSLPRVKTSTICLEVCSVIYLLLVAILLLNLLNLLGGGPLTRWVHHTRHHGARHGAIAVSWGSHGRSLRGHTAGWRHARSLHREIFFFHKISWEAKNVLGISFLFHKSLHSLQSGVCRYSTSCTEVYNVKQGLWISALCSDILQLVYVSRCKCFNRCTED